MKHISKRPIIIATIAVAAFIFLWAYVNDTLQKSRASQDQVTISFSPDSGLFAVNQQQSTDVIIQAADTKKISGVDISFSTSGGLQIIDIANPVPISSNDSTFFTQITKAVNPQSARIASVAQKSDAELPQAVKVHITYTGSLKGTGHIIVNQAMTQMVGNTQDATFGLGSVGEFSGSFTETPGVSPAPTNIPPGGSCGTNSQGACQTNTDCSACRSGGRASGVNGGIGEWNCVHSLCTAPTPPPGNPTQSPIATIIVPSATPTQTPITTLVVSTQAPCPTVPTCTGGHLMHGDPGPSELQCPQWFCVFTTPTPAISQTVTNLPCPKSRGDANCDFSIDIFDFEIWRKEFTGELTTKKADFNSDGHVDVLDFEIWRTNYFDQNK